MDFLLGPACLSPTAGISPFADTVTHERPYVYP